MSIGAKPWEGGGSASVPDASETTKGKIRIATSSEAATGTDDLTAMTPLTVKERIDASLVGGVEYKGTFNATTGTPSLLNAEQGDLYVIDVAGTIYGQDWSIGDQLLINADMGGSISNGKINKVDNTQAVTSVNTQTGAVTLTASDVGALASGDNVSELTNDSGYITSAPVTSVNTQTGVVTLTASDVGALASGDNVSELTNDSGYITSAPVSSVNTQTGVVTLSGDDLAADHTAVNYTAANANIDGHLSGIDSALGGSVTQLNDLSDVTITGAATGEVLRYSGSAWVDSTLAYADLSGTPTLATVATSGAYSDLSGTPTLATVATTGAYADVTGTPTLGTASALDVGTTANNVVQLNGSAQLPAVDGSLLTNLPSGATQLNDLSDVTITGAATGEVLRYSGSAWVDATLAYADISGTPTLAAVATSGAYADISGTPTLATVATTGAYADVTGTPTLATVATTGAYADVTGTPTLGTASALDVGTTANDVVQLDGSARLPAVDGSQLTNLPSGATQLNDLSDVTITGAATGEVLRYNGAAWVDATLAYADLSGTPTLATVATTGAYADISGTPTLATVATTGAYADVTGTPTLGTASTLDVGTTANDVVQLNGSAQLPAVDGSLLTNLPSGGGGYTYSAISATTTAQASYHYSVDTSGAAVTLNLPALSALTDGDEVRVKLRVAGNDLTIDANSTETIDGAQTLILNVATSSVTLVVGSTEWEIV